MTKAEELISNILNSHKTTGRAILCSDMWKIYELLTGEGVDGFRRGVFKARPGPEQIEQLRQRLFRRED